MFSLSSPCPECQGRGTKIVDPCPTCHGSGLEQRQRQVKVRIPAGVEDGQRIRVKGRGEPGANGGPAGDLYVIVHVATHPLFGRKGRNLTLTVPVTFPEATLGSAITVPSLSGPVTLKIPRRHAPGPDLPSEGPGDHDRLVDGRPARDRRRRRPGRAHRGPAQGRRGTRQDPGRLAPTAPRSVTVSYDPSETRLRRTLDPSRLRHLGRGRAGRRPPADAAHLRAQGPLGPGPHRRGQPPLQRGGHRPPAADPGAHRGRAEPGRACGASSPSRARSRRLRAELERTRADGPRGGRADPPPVPARPRAGLDEPAARRGARRTDEQLWRRSPSDTAPTRFKEH